jgi:putative SOS response-associated peptidase YedK
MCGRYGLYRSKMDYENALEAAGGLNPDRGRGPDSIAPNYNVSPTNAVWIARRDGRNVWLEPVVWGLLARWSKDPEAGPRPINARMETVATNKLFAPLLKKRRCLIPCDGFYEWKVTPSGKQPHMIRMKDGSPFFFAGLYDIWHEGGPEELATFTIITGEPNEMVAGIHNRMPVIVRPGDYERWLDPAITDPAALADILKPYPAEEMITYPISKRVNSPRNNDPGIIDPIP